MAIVQAATKVNTTEAVDKEEVTNTVVVAVAHPVVTVTPKEVEAAKDIKAKIPTSKLRTAVSPCTKSKSLSAKP